jgi:hypothetical protein
MSTKSAGKNIEKNVFFSKKQAKSPEFETFCVPFEVFY